MKEFTVHNLSKEKKLLDDAKMADSFFKRLKGLLGQNGLDCGEGLIIKPCNSIHTLGMKFPIDVIFLDKNNVVIHIIENISPGKLSPVIRQAKYVIEMKAGEIKSKGLEKGDKLEIL